MTHDRLSRALSSVTTTIGVLESRGGAAGTVARLERIRAEMQAALALSRGDHPIGTTPARRAR
jgi:hypothetical protein